MKRFLGYRGQSKCRRNDGTGSPRMFDSRLSPLYEVTKLWVSSQRLAFHRPDTSPAFIDSRFTAVRFSVSCDIVAIRCSPGRRSYRLTHPFTSCQRSSFRSDICACLANYFITRPLRIVRYRPWSPAKLAERDVWLAGSYETNFQRSNRR
jgi:hypothetical protein